MEGCRPSNIENTKASSSSFSVMSGIMNPDIKRGEEDMLIDATPSTFSAIVMVPGRTDLRKSIDGLVNVLL